MKRLIQFVYNCLFFVGALLFLIQITLSTIPGFFWWSEPLALLTPIFLGFVFVGFVFFVILRSKKVFLALFILLCHSDSILNFVQFNSTQNEGDVEVLNMNVRVFNKYPQLRGRSFEKSEIIIKYLENSDAGIVCLQEFYHRKKGGKFDVKSRLNNAGYCCSEILVTHVERGGGIFGMAIFSKHPIVKAESNRFEGSKNGWQRVLIDVNGKKLVVYNCHMESYKVSIDSGDYAGRQKEGLRERVKKVLSKRAREFNEIHEHIEQEDEPVILVGDMNSSAYSYGIYLLRDLLIDAYRVKGGWRSGTINKSKIPSLRIDYQFYSEDLRLEGYRVDKTFKDSDHFPVYASYTLPE